MRLGEDGESFKWCVLKNLFWNSADSCCFCNGGIRPTDLGTLCFCYSFFFLFFFSFFFFFVGGLGRLFCFWGICFSFFVCFCVCFFRLFVCLFVCCFVFVMYCVVACCCWFLTFWLLCFFMLLSELKRYFFAAWYPVVVRVTFCRLLTENCIQWFSSFAWF